MSNTVRFIYHYKTRRPLELDDDVALVGSSDSLLHSRHGKEIDAHKVIIRFNLAEVDDKYHEFVGSRTDYFLLNPRITTYNFKKAGGDYEKLMRICRKNKIICYPGHERNIIRFNKRPLYMDISHENFNSTMQKLLGTDKFAFPRQNHPRNGLKLIACLLDAGITPTLYGFDLEPRDTSGHYFDDELQVESDGAGHRPSLEYPLIKALIEKQLIKAIN